jgi:hypothetical protein
MADSKDAIVKCDVNQKKEWAAIKKELSAKYYSNLKNNIKHEKGGNIRVITIADKKKYVCVDTDDKQSNHYISSIMKKYNIKNNVYPSISNHFKHNIEENRHRFHYWFEVDNDRIFTTSHIKINGSSLDVFGPGGCYTHHPFIKKENFNHTGKVDSSDQTRIIYQPNVEGMYLDTLKTYPIITDEIYNDIMKINNKSVPSCLFHKNCLGFEKDIKRYMKKTLTDKK